MAAIIVARRRHRREQRARGRRERIFSTHIHLFGIPEEHIIWTYCLPSQVIFNLLQEIKDDLEPSTRSHAILALSKLLANSGSFQRTLVSLYFIRDYSNLHCAWCVALRSHANLPCLVKLAPSFTFSTVNLKILFCVISLLILMWSYHSFTTSIYCSNCGVLTETLINCLHTVDPSLIHC